jgi:uncharacterized LabA/DUF88 family protein
MFHSQKRVGWLIDWGRFKDLFEKKFKVKFIKYYRGRYSRREKIAKKIRDKHNHYGEILRRVGFEVIHRDLKKIYKNKKREEFFYKCDFDAEIGFDIASAIKKVDLVVLVSGDSDFASLSIKLQENKKSFLVICFKFNAPWEFFRLSHIFFEEIGEVRLK